MAFRPARTIYGYQSASLAPLNIALPWSLGVNDGMFIMNRNQEDAERDNLLFWAQTNWGEIPYKFKFGLDARRYIFDQIPFLKQKIEDNAKSQLSRYFPYLKIIKLQVLTTDEDPNISPNEIRFYLLAETPKGKKIEIQKTIGN